MSYFPDPPTQSKIEVSLDLENYATKEDLKGATGIDTTVFTKNVDFNKVKQDVQNLKNAPHTTDEDTKKEIASIKSKFNNFATTYTDDKKRIANDVGDKVSKGELSTEKANLVTLINAKASAADLAADKTLLTSMINLKADKSSTGKLLKDHKDLLTRLSNNQNSIKEYIKDKADVATKLKVLETEVKANKASLALEQTALNTSITNLQSKINKVDTTTAGVNTTLSGLSSTVGEMNKKVINIETKLKIGNVKPEIIDEYKFMFGQKFFSGTDGYQNLLIYPPLLSAIVPLDNNKPHDMKVKEWKSVGQLESPLKGNKGTAPTASMQGYKFKVDFDKTYLTGSTDINIGNPNFYLVYEFNQWSPDFGNKHPFHNCLFGSTDTNYKGRGIAFDSYGTWTHANGKTARNVLIFGTDNSKSSFDHNKLLNITNLGRGPLQNLLKGKSIEAEAMFDINFTEAGKKFVLSLHYNGANSYLFVNKKQIYKFTAQNNPVTGKKLNLGIISDGFSATEAKEVSLQGKVYEFSVDFRSRSLTDIEHIHSYLIKKHEIST